MDITLISPVAPKNVDAYNIRCLSSQLKKHGISTRLVFLEVREREEAWNTWSYDRFIYHSEKVAELIINLCCDSKVVGFSVMTPHFNNMARITRALKAKLNVPVIWGGIHPTLMPEEALEYADIVCVGDGEIPLLELMKRILDGEEYLDLEGMWFKSGGGLFKNNIRRLPDDLKLLPPQDYDLEEKYLVFGDKVIKLDETNIKNYHNNCYATMVSRGCVFKCTYCGNEALRNLFRGSKAFRKRDIYQVVEEIEAVKKRYKFIDTVNFYDPNFLSMGTDDIITFSRLYKERNKMPFTVVGFTPKQFREETLQALIDAGLTSITLGIQAANDGSRKLFDRKENNEEILVISRFVQRIREKYRVSITYDIILDNPWEKEDETIETLLFVSSLPRPFRLDIFSLRFFPGTFLFQKALKEGIIKGNLRDYYDQVYRGLNSTYINFLFMLVRDFPLGPSFVKFATLPRNRKIFHLIFNKLCYLGLWELYLLYFKYLSGYVMAISTGIILLREGRYMVFFREIKRKLMQLFNRP